MIDSAPELLQHALLPVQQMTKRLSVRRLQASGVQRLKESIERLGFLEQFPLIVTIRDDGTTLLIDGNHRLEAALAVGLHAVPCLIKPHLNEQECYTLALRSNSAAETVVPSTFVTYAEFIWARSDEGKTLEEIATMMDWSIDKVKKHSALRQIDAQAWALIVPTVEKHGHGEEEERGTAKVPTGTFSERQLRDLLDLPSTQQRELVSEFATNPDFKKSAFKARAERYRTRNDMATYASKQLGAMDEASLAHLDHALSSGAYDADWKIVDHPKVNKLIQAIRDEWERKHSIHLIQGDFYEEVQKLGDGCIDLIVTDPPYNISRENILVFEGRSNRSQDFGEWDKHPEAAFLAGFQIWAQAWARILRPQGSGYVFTSDRYISHLRDALEQAGLHVKATIVWHKTNPGTHPQTQPTNFTSSVEYVLFFTKGEGGHTFNWQGENEMHNFMETPICSGNERLVDGKGKTLHPTQKPERVIRHLLDISSNRGDTVFDGFSGVGTTGKVAKDRGRKFIGIEQDPTYFEAMQRRLAE